MLREKLDGDRAAQASVRGSVDLTHTTFANFGDESIGPERGAWVEGHRYHYVIRTARSLREQRTAEQKVVKIERVSSPGTGHRSARPQVSIIVGVYWLSTDDLRRGVLKQHFEMEPLATVPDNR
jgi:hypothetical protein